MQKKLLIVFSLISVALIGLIGRLMYIEYTSGAKYEKIVLSQQEYDSSTIPYRRGDIRGYERNDTCDHVPMSIM